MDAHSLQTPEQIKQNPFKSRTSESPLSPEQTKAALSQLYSNELVEYPRVERTYADPPIANQTFVLVSFAPSQGATPDDDGCYGCLKVRGVYGRLDEADERAEYIVKNVDSLQSILTAFVGRPFPLIKCDGEKYGAVLRNIEVKKKTEKVMDADAKEKRYEEHREIADIKKREENLKQDVQRDKEDIPEGELYTTMRVKRSQLIFTFIENARKMEQLQALIRTTDREIREMDDSNPEYKKEYMDRYMAARKESGFKDDEGPTEGFMKYLGDDNDIETILKSPEKF